MHDLIDIAVANSVVAAGIALAAWAAARYVRRPALTHALCVLVLLKLVTPPIFEFRVRLPFTWPAELSDERVANEFGLFDWNLAIQAGLFIWLVGSVCWFVLQFRFASQLYAAIQCATPAPASVSDAAARLARRMGLRRHPPVRLLSAADAPMLCGFGPGACIILPATMFERLSSAAQETILAHELAHYARRDHWVRMVEVIATGCFWWHPGVWWTRRQIESAEEQCCDALVMQYCAGQKRAYAEAILDVVDWLAERRRTTPSALLSRFGGHTPLHERLHSLLEVDRQPQRGRLGGPAGAFAAALCLFVQPGVEWASSVGTRAAATVSGENHAKAAAARIDKLQVERSQIWATAVSPGGDYEIAVRPGRRCELNDRATGRVRAIDGRQITCVAFAPDGKSFVVGDLDGSVRHIDAASGRERSVLISGLAAVCSLDVSAADNRVVAADDEGRVAVTSLSSRDADVDWTFNAPIRCVRFSPDGHQLAIALGAWRDFTAGRVEVVDLESRQVVQRWNVPYAIGAIRYASQDKLLTANWSGRIECRRISDGRTLGAIDAPKELVSMEAFSPHADALSTMAMQFDAVARRDSLW